jgi:SWI/SNF-related matrix-associated actin-dependent regulator of chromatin subfamily A3
MFTPSTSLSRIERAMAPKRRAETIDLTSDDTPFYSSSSQPRAHSSSFQSQGYADSQGYSSSPHRAPKQPRTAYNQAQRTTSGASQADAIFIEEDEDDASQEVPDATQAYNQQQYDYTLYGKIQAKIVGVRYYSGYATTGEMVVLRREPHNPYDANAIQALNVQGTQIGHIPRMWASKLARYMDERSLLAGTRYEYLRDTLLTS